MDNRLNELNPHEKLKAENEFLKMKMMLENDAKFGSMSSGEIPPQIENEFLKNVMEFEKEAADAKYIKLYEKIGSPTHFRPANSIGDEQIEKAWDELDKYLNDRGINLDVCSPNISARELYRFTTEELFNHEMSDMNIPGMMTCFIYDEFHPDHNYENTRAAVDDCIKGILEKEPFEWMHHFRKENLRLNNRYPLTQKEFKKIINRYKDAYENIGLKDISEVICTIDEKVCHVKGTYESTAIVQNDNIHLKGNWLVEFEIDEEFGYWYIINVQIGGIDF